MACNKRWQEKSETQQSIITATAFRLTLNSVVSQKENENET